MTIVIYLMITTKKVKLDQSCDDLLYDGHNLQLLLSQGLPVDVKMGTKMFSSTQIQYRSMPQCVLFGLDSRVLCESTHYRFIKLWLIA